MPARPDAPETGPGIAAPSGYAWPPGTGWAWRPNLQAEGAYLWPAVPVTPGAAATPDVKAFHETEGAAVAPGIDGLSLWAVSGGFLSLVADMPDEGVAALTDRHIITLAGRARLWADRPLHARLNVRHGPNTSRQNRPARLTDGILLAEFDLAYLDLRHTSIDGAWIDLIVERPDGAMLTLSDLTLSHRPRAEL